MKRVVMAGWLQRPERLQGKDFVEAGAVYALDGTPTICRSRVMVSHEESRRQLVVENTRRLLRNVHPDELAVRPGDLVRFRYTPNVHTVVNVRDSHDGAIAVLKRQDEHGLPLGGFAVRADDLRIVERRTNR